MAPLVCPQQDCSLKSDRVFCSLSEMSVRWRKKHKHKAAIAEWVTAYRKKEHETAR
jgi:hypothetical protein